MAALPRFFALLPFAALGVACGGKAAPSPPNEYAAPPLDGHFVFDCVAYDVGCPPAKSVGDVSQEPMPAGVAVGSTFLVSFVADRAAEAPYPLSIVPRSSIVVPSPQMPYADSAFPDVFGEFQAVAPGDAELDVVSTDGVVLNRTTVRVVTPSSVLILNPDGSPAALPLAMVPMGQACLYVAPAAADGTPLAGLPDCTFAASNSAIALDTQSPPGVVCINGESYGEAVVSVTCGPTTGSFAVVLGTPTVAQDAGSPADATVESGATDASADAAPPVCVTACGDASCVDPSTDPANCGGCGNVCAGTCQGGRCVTTLATGTNPYAIVADGTAVYWTDTADGGPEAGAVLRVPLDGGAPVVVAAGLDAPRFLAVDATSVYWTSGTEVMRAPKIGGVAVPLATGQTYPIGIAVDATSVYWTNGNDGQVMKAGLDGGAPAALVSLGAGHNFTQLVVSPTTAYWLNLASPYILSVPLAGGSVTTFYYDQNLYPIGIGIDSANVYYTEETGLGPVMACPLDGGTPTMLATNNGTQSVVSDGTNVYYTSPNGNAPTFDGAVLRVPVDGGAAVTLATGGAPQAIAVDGASAYFSRALDGTVVRVTPK